MVRRKYKFDLEIFESGCPYHKVGDSYSYPEEKAKLSSWLLDSANIMIRILEYDGKLLWGYEGINYEKMMSKSGITMEFVRNPDPTSAGVVLKIIRTKLQSDQVITSVP